MYGPTVLPLCSSVSSVVKLRQCLNRKFASWSPSPDSPEMIVNSALQEDVHVIGLSILSGAHNAIVPRVMDLLKQHKMDDVLVVVGGIIPDQDVEKLKQAGVAAIFQPGTPMDEIVSFIRENVKPRGVPAGER